MDRGHVEPGHRLHKDQPWLRPLLRRANGQAASGDGPAALSQRLQGDAATGRLGSAASLETAADDLRQLDE